MRPSQGSKRSNKAKTRRSELARKGVPFVFYGLVLFGLYLSSLYSYLLFHNLAEIFVIVVGCSIFILALNSRQRLDNSYVLFLGIAYLFVSGLDLLHTLAYKGMGVFPGYDANLPTQLWIAARYCQSISLLISPLFLHRKLNIYPVFAVYTVVTIAVIAAIFANAFPVCFVEGVGLTPFKKISEYIIAFMFIAAIAFLLYKRTSFDRHVLQWLVASLVLTVASELAFTLYSSVYGFGNLVGHFLKIIAFYLIYIAIVEMGLEKPQRLLFKNLKQNEKALQAALKKVQRLAITDPLTGLYNQRHFSTVAEEELRRACRYGRSLSAIMLDIDHFKRVNDTYGHTVGDHLLQEVAQSFRQELRRVDVVGRYGGDEFVVLLPENDLAAARQVAERLQKSIARRQIATPKGSAKITASLGVAALDCEETTVEQLLSRTDQALYAAKKAGRNRVRSG
ncbi:MAG: GGDEF domain-containing protein [Deltaproteobacteria bacterium]|nr:GGDEF domain-containing protein [Deltaproteobacteria bacterium]